MSCKVHKLRGRIAIAYLYPLLSGEENQLYQRPKTSAECVQILSIRRVI
jgi:hypothetical protein